ncbi:glycosyltransferase [Sutcliffiella horikoshii]|uniref:glycosyltransferase n=1 Tax=Sutcliffiella horikoshii TaxID=79883 RepID=UPI001CFEC5EC|nr:glycosyltransferase [Sutcliffiella horikoshii]
MISIITPTIRQKNMENVFLNYTRQNVLEKELIVILNKNEMDISAWLKYAEKHKNVTIVQLSENISLGECLNEGAKIAAFGVIAKFDDDDYYAPNYALEALNILEKKMVDIVGKSSIFVYYEEKKLLTILNPGYENLLSTTDQKLTERLLSGATLVFKKKVIEDVPFPHLNLGEDSSFQIECLKKGYVLFSSDRYNYFCVRKADKYFHTSVVSNQWLLRKSKIIGKTNTPETYTYKKKSSD